jgi:hypothetical protein
MTKERTLAAFLFAAVLAVMLAAVLDGCGPVADPRTRDVDLRPPVIQAVAALRPDQVSIEFDEEAALDPGRITVSPPLGVIAVTPPAKQVIISGETQRPGQRYTLEAEARDARGNSASFMAEFYGFNGRVPRLLVNELTPRGSGSHPDLVELKVLSAGNMGGVVFLHGTPSAFAARFVFPPVSVEADSFIVMHCRPAGEPNELNETGSPGESGGLDASEGARDFWVPEGKGLADNNGIVSLYDRPGGRCIDGVLYSNRTSQSDGRYRGFGSAEMLAQAEELVRDGGWKAAGSRVMPEDGVNPEGSTATRSLCRSSASADTDTADDWHIVPSRKATFGGENCDDAWCSPAVASGAGAEGP